MGTARVVVDASHCVGCGECEDACPGGCISLVDGVAAARSAGCVLCQLCVDVCPQGAVEAVREGAGE